VGLEVAPVTPLELPAEFEAFGRVLDPAPLAGLVFDLEAARAAHVAAQRESERVERLYRSDRNASARDRELAQAELGRTNALLETARARLAADLGESVTKRDDLSELMRSLVTGRLGLARVELPPGRAVSADPETTRLYAFDSQTPLAASFVGVAPQTDPLLQGRGLLFLIEPEVPAPGSAITASVRAPGEPLRGVEVPRSALLYHAGAVFVYVELEPGRFERRAIEPLRPSDAGWLVAGPLAAGDRVVVVGAPVLLSSELQPRSSED
jgi:hypothetical protein